VSAAAAAAGSGAEAAREAPGAACPLCGGAGGAEVERVAYADVWQGLASEWGARISGGVRTRHSPADSAALVECSGCGLRHFVPAVPGDAEFYGQLSTSSAYYSAGKWEFGEVCDRIAPGQTVLDVGCGDGHFVRMLRGVAAAAVGLETNPEAVQRARAEGLDVRLAGLDEFAAENAGAFDVVCSFHVLEHLPDVRGFVLAMLRCLKPGGSLVVSVPNRLRMAEPGVLQPLDCPPHHLSRWHPRQFAEMARLYGLELREVGFDPPDVDECRAALRRGLLRAWGMDGAAGGAAYLLARLAARVVFGRALHAAYRRAGLLPRMGIYRQNMMAHFTRPEAWAS
jgi:SAM-dependent methyltransferase